MKRWDFGENVEKDIDCPAQIPEYNSFMGQTKNIGRLLTLYRIKIDNRKRFYLRIFFHYANLAVINSWLLYRRDSDDYAPKQSTIDLWEFKSRLTSAAQQARPSQNNTRKRPKVINMPIGLSSQRRCKFPDCKGIIRTQCSKCEAHLCFTTDENFKNFHLQ